MSDLKYISESLRPLALPIASLSPDPANARLHNEKNLDSIKASLHKFGQRKPVVVQKKGMIVRAGNGTMAAAKSLGWTHLACNVIDEDSTEATSFAIADNRTAELATWDDETLASLLQSLPTESQVAAGFDENDLKELISKLTPKEAIELDAQTVGGVTYRVIVSVSGEEQQAELIEQLESEGYTCQPLMS